MNKASLQDPKPVPANNDLPSGPECANYVGEDEFDVKASEEGRMMRRAFQSSKGLDVVGTVFSVAAALASRKVKGQTEKKPEPLFELPPNKRLRLRRRKGGKSK